MVEDGSCSGGGQLRLEWWEVCTKPKIEIQACGALSHKKLPRQPPPLISEQNPPIYIRSPRK